MDKTEELEDGIIMKVAFEVKVDPPGRLIMSTYQRWIDSSRGDVSMEGDEKMWNRCASKGLLLFHKCFWSGFSELFNTNFSQSCCGVDRWEWGPASLVIQTGTEPSTFLALILACVLKRNDSRKKNPFWTRRFRLCHTQIWLLIFLRADHSSNITFII